MLRINRSLMGVTLALGLVGAAATCNTAQQNTGVLPTPAVISDINGKWAHAAVGDVPAVCLTITDRKVTQIDLGCVGTNLAIFASPTAPDAGVNVTLIVSAGPDANDDTRSTVYTYQVVSQSDGTLRGPALLQERPSGVNRGGLVVFVRQP